MFKRHARMADGLTNSLRSASQLALCEAATTLPQVSDKRALKLQRLHLQTVEQLLEHFPRRYIDMSAVKKVAQASIGSQCSIFGTIHAITLKTPRPRLSLVEISVLDDSGILMVTMFRQPWLMNKFHVGDTVGVSGKLEFSYGYKRMTNPFIELIDAPTQCGLIVALYPLTEGITNAWMTRFVHAALAKTRGMYDFLPLDVRLRRNLMSRTHALCAIHAPLSMEELACARRRLVYEEVFTLQVSLMSRHAQRSMVCPACTHVVNGKHVQAYLRAIPFELSCEQQAACRDIWEKMALPTALNHMLLGDVGCGKTVVAGSALACVADSHTQAALLAPTEILARQHAKTLGAFFDAAHISWALLCGSTPRADRKHIYEQLASGKLNVLIGTHALLEDEVMFHQLSLCVIDEQQRFGVSQRAALLQKGRNVDTLYLSATPIPRTLAMALYGACTFSYIKHPPVSTRGKRTTHVVAKSLMYTAYDAARDALARGEQVYIVCPLVGIKQGDNSLVLERGGTSIHGKRASGEKRAHENAKAGLDESLTRSQSLYADNTQETYEYAAICIEDEADYAPCSSQSVASAQSEAQFLQTQIFPGEKVGLLYGGLPAEEKAAVMNAFSRGDISVLVSTTVIEVGIDVANATIMIIEDADRFGLSQLHQLRGRVGRSSKDSDVYLVSSSQSPVALNRLSAMTHCDDGFKLALFDLALRREGDILGNRQHGASHLSLVNIIRDSAIIQEAYSDAQALVACDAFLQLPEHSLLAREVRTLHS